MKVSDHIANLLSKKTVEAAIREIKNHYGKNINNVHKSCFSIKWLSSKYKKNL